MGQGARTQSRRSVGVRRGPSAARLREAVDRLCGERASKCGECHKAARDGGYECDACRVERKPGSPITCNHVCNNIVNGDPVCPYPIPSLDPQSKLALNLFLSCHSPNPQWEIGFSGRSGIPDERIARRAERLGIETNDILLDKVDACVAVVREWDSKQSTAESE